MESAQFHGIAEASCLGASLPVLAKDDQTMNEVHIKTPLSSSSLVDDLHAINN
jgi:hypothetical protein